MSPEIRKIFRNDNALGALLASAALAVYLTTLAPSIGFTDAGELAAVAATFGVAHPTGYPLFTMLAGTFAKLPIGGTVVWRLNLFAALCCAASLFFFFRFFLALLRMEGNGKGGGGDSLRAAAAEAGEERLRGAAAAVGTLALAFSRTFWEQSTGVEVYSLHLLMVSLVLWFFVVVICRAGQRPAPTSSAVSQGSVRSPDRAWFLFAFCLGLSFANHMTTVLLLPGLAWLFFATHGAGRPAWTRLARSALPFLAGLSLYLYLPLRAAAGPALNWGNPVTFENFWRHVTGRQYSVWMFSSLETALGQFGTFAASFPGVFGWAALVPMAAGLVLSWRAARRLFAFTGLLFLACVLYAVNYDIHDISSYFLPAHVAAAAWIARGALALLEFASLRNLLPGRGKGAAVAALAGLCVMPPLFMHYRAVDESGNHAVEDYARNLFASLDSGATIVTYQWDNFVSAAYYLQLVEGYRTDVVILERELLRRSWYIAQLERRHPRVVAEARAETEAFLRAVRPFERGEAYNASAIQAAFEAMIGAMLHRSADHGPVYATPEVEREYLRGFGGVPSGLAFRLFRDSVPPEVPTREFSIRPFPGDGRLFDGLREAYAAAYVNMAWHRGAAGNPGAARRLLGRALEIRPGFPRAAELLRRMEGSRSDK